MATYNYNSKKQALKALKDARDAYADARKRRQKDSTPINIAAEKEAQKKCIDIQYVLDRWF